MVTIKCKSLTQRLFLFLALVENAVEKLLLHLRGRHYSLSK